MPLFEEKNTHQNKETNQTDKGGFETQNHQQSNQKPSKLMTLIANLLPMAPLAFEQFTGQKVPQMSGTIAEIQMALLQVNNNLQTVVNNQQQFLQRINQLETSASNQLTNLTNQFKSLRLTHTKERKEIELQSNASDFDKSRQYNPNKQITEPEAENY